MAMGIVDDNELERELNKLNKNNSIVVNSPSKGRAPNDVNVPDSLRKIIGETNEIDGRKEAVALAKMFDISSSSVSAYANGVTSTASYNEKKTDIQNHINESKARIAGKARARLMNSLKHITDEKLSESKPAELALVARHMATVMREMEPPKEQVNENNGIQFIFYSPNIRKEEVYDVIDVSNE